MESLQQSELIKIEFRTDEGKWISYYPRVPGIGEHVERGRHTLYIVKGVEWRCHDDWTLDVVVVWLTKSCEY